MLEKLLEKVDGNQSNGFAFIGDWLSSQAMTRGTRGKEPHPLLRCGRLREEVAPCGARPQGRRKRLGGNSAGKATSASTPGRLRFEMNCGHPGRRAGQQPEDSPLAGLSDEELIAELERRGYAVFRCGIDSGTGAELIYRVSRKEGEQ